MKVHSCIVQLTLAACVALPGLAAAAPIAYVPNEGSGTISIIDTAKDTVVETVAVGKKPRGIAISGNWLYVSDQLHNSLQLVNLKTRKLGPAIALGKSPEGVYASADGQWVAAAIEENDEVAVVDTKSRSVAFRIPVKGENPEHAVFSPDGKKMLVSAEDGSAVDILDLASRRQIAQLKVGDRPRGIGFLPGGAVAYVAAENS